jgi:predicted metal-dependent phosphoesterase TrpH
MTPTSTIDLHTHTYYSDGKYSPAELLRYAASIGLETMAITDHDNAHGVREAWPLAQE